MKNSIGKLILAFLWVTLIISLLTSYLSKTKINPYTIFAVIGLMIVSIIFFKFQKIFNKALFILLILGSLNFITFINQYNLTLSLGFGNFRFINLQVYSLTLLILYSFVNRKKIKKQYIKIFGKTEQEIINEKKSLTKMFKKKFKDLNEKEINDKLKENLVDEAKEALFELLKEKYEK